MSARVCERVLVYCYYKVACAVADVLSTDRWHHITRLHFQAALKEVDPDQFLVFYRKVLSYLGITEPPDFSATLMRDAARMDLLGLMTVLFEASKPPRLMCPGWNLPQAWLEEIDMMTTLLHVSAIMTCPPLGGDVVDKKKK